MRKIIAILALALVMMFSAAAEETRVLAGNVVDITENGFIMNTSDYGNVEILDGQAAVGVGDFVYVHYDGTMTRSLPLQVRALEVKLHRYEGQIIEYSAEDRSVLFEDVSLGKAMVFLTEEQAVMAEGAEYITVYGDGMMTASMPPHVNGGEVIFGYFVQGKVTEISDEYVILGEGRDGVQVNLGMCEIPGDLAVGDAVRVMYNGMKTFSLPPQVSAEEFIFLCVEEIE